MTAKPIGTACVALLALAACAAGGALPESSVTLRADLFAREGPDILYAIGHVRLARGTAVITADAGVVWTADQEAYLEGHVVYRVDKSVMEAERAYVHWSTVKSDETGKTKTVVDRGFLFRSDIRWHERPDQVPWHIRAEDILQTDVNRFVARRRVMLSPCQYEEPHTYFRASEIEIVGAEKLVATNLTYHVRGLWVPPTYWPKLYVPLGWQWPEMKFGFGSSGRYGWFIQTEVLYDLPQGTIPLVDSQVGVRLDHYSKRGIGYGGSFRYQHGDTLRGELEAYTVPNDRGKDQDRYELGTTDRYRLKYVHSQDMPEGWEFDVEYERDSDAGFREEYFRHEFRREKPIEDRAYLKYSDGPIASYLHYRWQPMPWLDTTEYLPQIGANVFSYPIWRNLLYTGHIELAHVRRRLSDLRLEPDESTRDLDAVERRLLRDFIHRPLRSTIQEELSDGRRFWRFDNYHQLSMPFTWSIFHFEPFVGTRQTWYSETLTDDDSSAWRGMLVYGARVSTEFWRSWDDVRADSLRLFGAKVMPLEVDGLRHVITPELRLMSIERPTINPDELILTDGNDEIQPPADLRFARVARRYQPYDSTGLAFGDVDSIYPVSLLNFGVRNRWQTRRGERIVDLIDIDPSINFFFHKDRDNGGKAFSDLATKLQFNPISGVYFFADFEYGVSDAEHPAANKFHVFDSGLYIATSTRWQLFLSQRYDDLEGNRLGATLHYVFSEKWSTSITYEFKSNGSEPLDLAFRLTRDLHDWIAEFSIQDDREAADKAVGFSLRPKTRRQLISGLFYTRELGHNIDPNALESYQQYNY